MNTNSNVYTIIYTTIVVVIVAATLAVAAMAFAPMQSANIKAETLSQMMVAANVKTMDEFSEISNDEILGVYSENIREAFSVNLQGEKVADLKTAKNEIELIDNFKPQDKAIKADGDVTIPVYRFKSGVTVFPVYGAGLWGPIWGYVALESDLQTIKGVYFDHSGETPGLGSKIKDDPAFQAQFIGKRINVSDPARAFAVVKGGAPEGDMNAVDAITGATITSRALGDAIQVWFAAYIPYIQKASAELPAETTNMEE